jgi:hypothetical protein
MAPIIEPIKEPIKAIIKPSYNPKDSIYADPAMDRRSSEGIGEINDCRTIAIIKPTGPKSTIMSWRK